MSKTGSFLWRLFCAIVMFFYHKPSNAAVSTDLSTKKLCPSPNQYVVSCSGIAIGTEWLKGVNFQDRREIQNRDIRPFTIDSFYNGAGELSEEEKSIALRYFLDSAGIQPTNGRITNTHPQYESTNLNKVLDNIDSTNNRYLFNQRDIVNSSDPKTPDGNKRYVTVAGDLLTLLCADTTKVKCATCPDDGVVDDSLYLYDQFSIYANTWKIYTIADCYKYEFSNTNGTYSYYESETSQEPYKFYYNVSNGNTTGSQLHIPTTK